MKSIFYQLISNARRATWAILVAYMLGIHNFYKGEDRTPDTIVAIEVIDVHSDVRPKD